LTGADLIHPTYRHLGREIRIAGLPLTHWGHLVVAGLGAYLLSRLLPFGAAYNLSVAVTIAGTPAAIVLAGGTGEVELLAYGRAVVRWRRNAAVYAAGAAPATPMGYALVAEPSPALSGGTLTDLDPLALWDD
jgi:hypothetical protein